MNKYNTLGNKFIRYYKQKDKLSFFCIVGGNVIPINVTLPVESSILLQEFFQRYPDKLIAQNVIHNIFLVISKSRNNP